MQVPCAFLDSFESRGVRALGSAALELAELARGSADAFLLNGLKCWDVAAGALIVEEAGGVVRNLLDSGSLKDGRWDVMGRQCLAAATAELADEIASRFRAFKEQ